MKEKILFIAGGSWQRPFVQYLKDKGHYICIVNPVATGTTDLADYHIKSDVNDLDEISKHIEKIRPLFITSDQSDISTLAVSKLSERWGLPGNSVAVIQRFTNKYEIFKFAKSIGIPVPETRLVSCAEDIRQFARAHGFPVIIKPTDATFSRGFRKIDLLEEITEEVFASALKFSKSGQVITQTFISGDMVTLEGVCSGGKHRTLATSKKDEYFQAGIASGVRYPSNVASIDEIIEANDLYVESAAMNFGLTHSEYIYNESGFYLIEIGGRGGGAGITNKIVPWVSGVEVYDIFYSSLMGEVVDVKNYKLRQRPALLKYYHHREMALCDEQRLARLISKISGVAEFQFDFAGKQYVSDKNDSRHTMAIYLSDSMEGIETIVKEVDKIIRD